MSSNIDRNFVRTDCRSVRVDVNGRPKTTSIDGKD